MAQHSLTAAPRDIAELRGERLIASSRLVLAALTLLALWLEPGEPARQAALGYTVVAAYVLLAAAIVVTGWLGPALVLRWRLAMHVVDMATFCAIIFFTTGATSPFFAFLVFALIAASLRWQWPGILATAGSALASYLAISFYSLPVRADESVLLTVSVRSVYLAVFAILLGYLGSYHGRLRRDLQELATWPAELPRDHELLIDELLARTARVLGVDTVLLLLVEPGEPALTVRSWTPEARTQRRLAPDAFGSMVAPALEAQSFATPAPSDPRAAVLCLAGGVLRRWHGAALDLALAREIGDRPALVLHLPGHIVRGFLLAIGKQGRHSDDLVLGSLLALQIAPLLDQVHLAAQERRVATSLERLRLARDLHDGTIQALTGASLRLQTVGRLLDERPAEARRLLEEVDDVLVNEQQELRWFLVEGRGGDAWLQRLQLLPERLAHSWGLRAEVDVDLDGAELPEGVGHEIYRIVQEALVNAARHGKARTARAELREEEGTIQIVISDDGRGFPFTGDFDDTALREQRIGPVSVKQRVATMGGRLRVRSSAEGARLDIQFPREAT